MKLQTEVNLTVFLTRIQAIYCHFFIALWCLRFHKTSYNSLVLLEVTVSVMPLNGLEINLPCLPVFRDTLVSV